VAGGQRGGKATYGLVSAGEKLEWFKSKMERRSRGDALSFYNLFLLGVSAGVIIGIIVTVFQLYNPLSGIINLKYATDTAE
jgi:hypothetical protein